jgi:hypothetical protein
MENLNLSTEAQRFDQIEKLRNEIRPNKSYQVKDRALENLRHTTLIAPVHDHEVKFSFIGFNPTPAEFKTTGTWTAQLENNLRAEHAIKHAPKQPETTTDANGYYFGDNLTPEQETHNLRMDEQLHEAVKQLNERESTSNETN